MNDYLKYIIIGLLAAIIITIILMFFGILPGFKERTFNDVTLTVWGVFDDVDVYPIADMRKQYPYIKINYIKKPIATYENDLVKALASGEGPDVFAVHNTWLPKYKSLMAPMPQNLISLKAFREAFVDVVYNDFVDDNKIYAAPMFVDTLALFYNKNMLNSAGIAEPPATWEAFINAVEKITKKDQFGNILVSGAAIGTAKNINRSTDILSLLMLQSGIKMVDLARREAIFDEPLALPDGSRYNAGEEALRFYTDFSSPLKRIYTWNKQMHYSIDAFNEESVAMMFNYAYQLPTIFKKSPNLNFAVSKMPQFEQAKTTINYANYWGYSVALMSSKQNESWNFLNYLTSYQGMAKYLQNSARPSPRRDLIDWQRNDGVLGVFAEQALSAASWRQPDSAAVESIFIDAIESVADGRVAPSSAISLAADQITLFLRR